MVQPPRSKRIGPIRLRFDTKSRDSPKRFQNQMLLVCSKPIPRRRVSGAPPINKKSRRSISRVLSTSSRMLDGHSSGTRLAACLDATNPGDGSKTLPRSCPKAQRRPPLFGLAPGGVYPANPVARVAVRSYRTVSPLPRTNAEAVCFLWHCPWGRPRRPLAGTVFPWSPDFPPAGYPASGRPTVWMPAPCTSVYARSTSARKAAARPRVASSATPLKFPGKKCR
jgi:hypothetical protein